MLYEIPWKNWIKDSFLILFLLQIIDELVTGTAFLFLEKTPHDEKNVLIYGCIGCLVWILLFLILKLLKKDISLFFSDLTSHQNFLLLSGIFALNSLVAMVQGNLYDEMNLQRKKVAFLLSIFALLYIMIIFLYLGFILQRKNFAEKIVETQNEYYENLLQQYETLRSFKHDIRQHLQMISLLCEQENINNMKNYISQLNTEYSNIHTVYTENKLVDYMFYTAFSELEKDPSVHIRIIGRLSEDLILSDVDSCILFSNLFRNAAEALKQISGEKELELEFFCAKKEWCISIRNSKNNPPIDISKTTKTDSNNHGYGTKNIKKIVKKYEGEITWNDSGKWMEVKIFLPKK